MSENNDQNQNKKPEDETVDQQTESATDEKSESKVTGFFAKTMDAVKDTWDKTPKGVKVGGAVIAALTAGILIGKASTCDIIVVEA